MLPLISLLELGGRLKCFNLEQQLAHMNRAGGASKLDGWYSEIGSFMKGAGTLPNAPAPAEFITDAFMKRVQADAKLREFANRTN